MSKASRKRRAAQTETPAEAQPVEVQATEAPAEAQPAEVQPAEVQPAAEPAPVTVAATADRANNALQFIGKALFHKGGHVNWPKHVVANGTASEELVRENPGITFEVYKAKGGSVSRLCYMVKKAKLVEAKVVEAPAEQPAAAEAPAEATPAAAE